MHYYSEYSLYSNKSSELYKESFFKDEISLTELLSFSSTEDMKPLSIDNVFNHPIGVGMIGTWYSGHGYAHKDVLTYAGITGFEKYDGKNFAVIGGLITHPDSRKMGLGRLTVGRLLQIGSFHNHIIQYGYEGFIAKCNEKSSPLLKESFGFIDSGIENGKHIVTKELSYKFVPKINWPNLNGPSSN